MNGVHLAEGSDAERLANLLAASLVDDPFWAWVLPEPSDRRPRLRAWLAMRVGRVELGRGEVWATPAWDAAAAWLPPATSVDSTPTDDEVELLGDGLDRLRAAEEVAVGQGTASPPGWRLSVVATDPGSRKHGLAAAVLEPGLERCDASAEHAWALASPDTAAFLERFGFVADDGVASAAPVTVLRRQPGR
jgi:GNAT superfamily N-acetyltransferase